MNTNNALKFDEFILSVLKQICIKEGTAIFTYYDFGHYNKNEIKNDNYYRHVRRN